MSEGRNRSQCRHCNEFIENRKLEDHERICQGRGSMIQEAPETGKSKTQQIKDLLQQHYGKSVEIDYGMGEMQCKRLLKKIDLKLWVESRKTSEDMNIDIQDALLEVLSKKG